MSNLTKLEEFIKDKSILIVGGSPSAKNKNREWYDSFDVIVRLNNYKKVNSNRTDIFFSYFGRNIKKSIEELIGDGVKFLINKCPNENITELDTNDSIQMNDYRWIYELRKDWWFCPLISLTKKQLLSQIDLLDGSMPTVGTSAILFFKELADNISIIGFDCFESNIHNLDEEWDNSGNHDVRNEKILLTYLEHRKAFKWHK